jgi:hypothetical protein
LKLARRVVAPATERAGVNTAHDITSAVIDCSFVPTISGKNVADADGPRVVLVDVLLVLDVVEELVLLLVLLELVDVDVDVDEDVDEEVDELVELVVGFIKSISKISACALVAIRIIIEA